MIRRVPVNQLRSNSLSNHRFELGFFIREPVVVVLLQIFWIGDGVVAPHQSLEKREIRILEKSKRSSRLGVRF